MAHKDQPDVNQKSSMQFNLKKAIEVMLKQKTVKNLRDEPDKLLPHLIEFLQ
jgi:hypothetical protein